MSSELLDQAFGITDYQVLRTTRGNDGLTFHLEQPSSLDR